MGWCRVWPVACPRACSSPVLWLVYSLGGGLLWSWLGLCPGLGWAWAGLVPPSTRAPPCCRAWLGLLPGCSRAGGGVVWWSVVGWECLALLPLFWPTPAAYGLVTLLPLLPCSLTYPGCPWPIPWLPYAYSLATYGRCLALFPTSFRGYCRASPLLPSALLSTALGWPVLHLPIHGAPPRDLSYTWERC